MTSGLGRPLYMDKVIEDGTSLDFARVCIETSLEDSFLESIDMFLHNGKKVSLRVEYSWKYLKCPSYSRFRHGKDVCMMNKKENVKRDFVGGKIFGGTKKTMARHKGKEGLDKEVDPNLREPIAMQKGKDFMVTNGFKVLGEMDK